MAHEVLLIQAVFMLEVYAYLVVAVTYKIWSSHAGLSDINHDLKTIPVFDEMGLHPKYVDFSL